MSPLSEPRLSTQAGGFCGHSQVSRVKTGRQGNPRREAAGSAYPILLLLGRGKKKKIGNHCYRTWSVNCLCLCTTDVYGCSQVKAKAKGSSLLYSHFHSLTIFGVLACVLVVRFVVFVDAICLFCTWHFLLCFRVFKKRFGL